MNDLRRCALPFGLVVAACGPKPCPGSSNDMVVAAPNDPTWTTPGEGRSASTCILASRTGMTFHLADGRSASINVAECSGDTCLPGQHVCLELATPGANDVYATIGYAEGHSFDSLGVLEAGGYGGGTPLKGTSCSFDVTRNGTTLAGRFDGTLGHSRVGGVIDYERLRFNFTYNLGN